MKGIPITRDSFGSVRGASIEKYGRCTGKLLPDRVGGVTFHDTQARVDRNGRKGSVRLHGSSLTGLDCLAATKTQFSDQTHEFEKGQRKAFEARIPWSSPLKSEKQDCFGRNIEVQMLVSRRGPLS